MSHAVTENTHSPLIAALTHLAYTSGICYSYAYNYLSSTTAAASNRFGAPGTSLVKDLDLTSQKSITYAKKSFSIAAQTAAVWQGMMLHTPNSNGFDPRVRA